jgi:uncharacterized radical SAM superfamily Fe-S cluster-containing enzyme
MDEYLTTTTSTCGRCGRLLPARVHLGDDGVHFLKDCPAHGPQRVRVYPDSAAYLELGRFHRAGAVPMAFAASPAGGCPDSCGLCPEHEQHVCLPIIEITDHCDLACPICLVRNRSSFHLSRRQVAGMIDGLIASEGRLDVLNLSGGEPTCNPRFREIVEECVSREEVLYVSVSTNGVALARDTSLLRFLADRNVIISLQFDGLSDSAYQRLRGRPLLEEKLRLIETAGELGARLSLTMTVARGINDDQPPEVLSLLFERDHVCSVMFQPAAYTGTAAKMGRPQDAVTIPDVVGALDGAGGGRVAAGDFSPLPCSHPACFSLAYYLRVGDGEFVSIKRLADVDRYLDMIQNRALFGTDAGSFQRVKEAVYELWSGPAALAPDSRKALAAVRGLLESIRCCGGFHPSKVAAVVDPSIKSVFIHHFMDRDTFDLARARKCCNVYPLPDGRLMPACVYNCLRR